MDACEQPSEDESVTRKFKMIGSKEALQMWTRETQANEAHVSE